MILSNFSSFCADEEITNTLFVNHRYRPKSGAWMEIWHNISSDFYDGKWLLLNVFTSGLFLLFTEPGATLQSLLGLEMRDDFKDWFWRGRGVKNEFFLDDVILVVALVSVLQEGENKSVKRNPLMNSVNLWGGMIHYVVKTMFIGRESCSLSVIPFSVH